MVKVNKYLKVQLMCDMTLSDWKIIEDKTFLFNCYGCQLFLFPIHPKNIYQRLIIIRIPKHDRSSSVEIISDPSLVTVRRFYFHCFHCWDLGNQKLNFHLFCMLLKQLNNIKESLYLPFCLLAKSIQKLTYTIIKIITN